MNFETIQDFLEDDRFSRWLQTTDQELDQFWRSWLEENEDKKELFYKAVSAWLLIRESPKNWSEGGISEKLSALNLKLTQHRQTRRFPRYWYYAAATLVIGMISLLTTHTFSTLKPSAQSVSEPLPAQWDNVENTTNAPVLVNLPDGSSALLSGGSTLAVDPDFNSLQRSVHLKGEAFFEVVKNAALPFYVHTSTLTTRVLGTSFTVRSFDDENNAKVTVLTGKVEVRPSSAPGNDNSTDDTSGLDTVVLVENEEVSLLKATDQLLKSIPEKTDIPFPHLPENQTFDLKFVQASEIFSMLEKMYGVRIIYDIERFSNCTLTANLEDMPFLKKLELICAGIDAEYTITGSEIQIFGNGC